MILGAAEILEQHRDESPAERQFSEEETGIFHCTQKHNFDVASFMRAISNRMHAISPPATSAS